MFFSILIFIGLLILSYKLMKKAIEKNKIDNTLTTDMEFKIAELDIKPTNNKRIKIAAKYLEENLMPNEEVYAVAPTSDMLNGLLAIITNRRLMYKGVINQNYTQNILLEKINNVTQNGTYVYINNQYIVIPNQIIANKFVNLLNNKIASIQNSDSTIKVENKIVTEESITSQLQKLANLHDSKVLTDYEYSVKKQELLDKLK